MKIRPKILLLFSSLALIGAGLWFMFVNYAVRDIMIKTIGTNNVLVSQQNIDAIDRIIYRRLERWDSYAHSNNDLVVALQASNQEFSERIDVNQYIADSDQAWINTQPTEITPFMQSIIDSQLSAGLRDRTSFYNDKYGYQIFPEMFVTNAYGVNVAATGKTSDYNQADEAWWQATKERGLYVGDIDYDASTGTNAIEFGIAVHDDNMNMIGVIKVVYNIQDIFDVLGELKNQGGDSVNAYLLTADERLIYSLADGFGNLAASQKILQPDNRKSYYLGSINGTEHLFSHADSAGYKDFRSLGWSIVISNETTVALAPLKQLLNANMVSIGIFMLLVVALGFVVSYVIVRPIKKLSAGALLIKGGQIDHRVEAKSSDEIGDLGRSFNSMVEAVQKSRAEIDQKVRDQTKEINYKADTLLEQRTAILNVLEDVEAEKKKTDALAKDLEKFKLAVDNASDHVVVTDAEGIVLYGNLAMEKITGYTAKEALGTKAGVLWRKPMGQKYYENLWTTIKAKKKIFEGIITNVRKGGEEYQAQISISPIMDKKGNIIYFVGLERDITKEKQIDKAKTEFVSLASHQLRTPLTAINWYTEMLLNGDAGKVSATQKNYLDEIYSGNQRMVTLVNMLLNVSRLELGTFTVEPQPTALSELADDVLKELKPQIIKKKIKITRQYQPTVPVMNIDPKLTRIIFQNLLSNSVKYTPAKGVITVKLALTAQAVRITVQDTGYGIPAMAQDKIFTKLFRADNARIKDTDGTGLGLYIVKSIVEQAGGRIWFESVENRGTTFYVDLTLRGMIKKEGSKTLT